MSGAFNPKVAPGGSAIGQAALGNQVSTASSLAGQGGGLFSSGQQKINQAGGYFSTLASGGRAATAQTLAPDVQNINDVYAGTANTMSRFLRGPDKTVQMGEASRQRAQIIGNLFAGARTGANGALASMGQAEAGTGVAAEGAGGSLFGSVANTSQNAQIEQNKEQEQAGSGFGGLLFNVLKSFTPLGA